MLNWFINLIKSISYAFLCVCGTLCIIVACYNESLPINILLFTVGVYTIIYSFSNFIKIKWEIK